MARPMPRIPPVTTATLAMLSSLQKHFFTMTARQRDAVPLNLTASPSRSEK